MKVSFPYFVPATLCVGIGAMLVRDIFKTQNSGVGPMTTALALFSGGLYFAGLAQGEHVDRRLAGATILHETTSS